ncbi:D-cysteine desulfhydrase family protein [Miniphocaeibacter massiliensis]|uniref:D-cysteine desulfhydrase family protein n=1 Tax=Miniphocaeibacter massiliensis TaxID=2041841 RepID=UPI000C1B8558|nr:D-cysteine desulfhydrase family protein [Miniphocaeibacter massiliensis]
MEKISLANLPTPIVKLEELSKEYGKNIYLKRDDFTGTEVSGNKVRKLEYAIAEAIENKCDTIITVGALQSNHCRATSAVCAKLNLDCHLLLRGEDLEVEGNLFLDYMLGSNIHILREDRDLEKEAIKLFNKLEKLGKKPYIIPMGASNKIGTYGYIEAFNEISKYEEKEKINFDLISMAVGSGGTYSGIWYGNYTNKTNKKVLGFSVSSSSVEFKEKIMNILKEIDNNIEKFDSVEINDLYVGEGYGKSNREEIEFYLHVAKTEGIILDPCYTGKAFRGLIKEIQDGNIKEDNILFIHTGGLMGWTKEQRNMAYKIVDERS